MYPSLVAQQYNSITAESEMKMDKLQPQQGVFNFSGADTIASFARDNGKKVHGHTLVWSVSTPAWFSSLTSAAKRTAMESHIRTVVSYFKDKYPGTVASWDVVNEAIASNGTIRTNTLTNIGTHPSHHVYYAFKAAQAADPNAQLYMNDFGIQVAGVKQDGLVNLINLIRGWGAVVHGVGIQGHFNTDVAPPTITQLRATIQRFGAMGLKVKFTELDVRTKTSDGTSSTELSWQSSYYYNVTRACVLEPACVGITTWGFNPTYSWIPKYFTGYSAILPFDSNYQPTNSFNLMTRALKGL